jgi:hypothetical protein
VTKRDQVAHALLAHVAERHRRTGFVALFGHDRGQRPPVRKVVRPSTQFGRLPLQARVIRWRLERLAVGRITPMSRPTKSSWRPPMGPVDPFQKDRFSSTYYGAFGFHSACAVPHFVDRYSFRMICQEGRRRPDRTSQPYFRLLRTVPSLPPGGREAA